MLNFLIIYHCNSSLQCNSGQQKDAEKFCVRSSTLLCTTVLSCDIFCNVKGGKGVTNTLLNISNNYYIAILLDVTIVNVNLVENIIFYVGSSVGEYKIVDVYSPMNYIIAYHIIIISYISLHIPCPITYHMSYHIILKFGSQLQINPFPSSTLTVVQEISPSPKITLI